VSAAVGGVLSVANKPITMLNEGFAGATNFIAQALPAFPAATITSLTIGAPHAHTLHPPSGPLPIPPTPLPPVGPVMLGTCVQVLINGKPAARSGDLGFNPTCCGLPPLFEIFTGSSKVFIGGSRAARQLDITFHCKNSASAASRAAAGAMKAASRAATAASAVAQIAMIGAQVAGQGAQLASIAGDAIEAADAETSAMSAAMGMSAAMAAAQMAADAVAMALSTAMGKDVCVPPGTPGAVLLGSPNVLIGGFPMPSWTAIAKGLVKLVKGLKNRKACPKGRSSPG
jgi:uncharacterized Zn-binding protein involved in type VI secretion